MTKAWNFQDMIFIPTEMIFDMEAFWVWPLVTLRRHWTWPRNQMVSGCTFFKWSCFRMCRGYFDPLISNPLRKIQLDNAFYRKCEIFTKIVQIYGSLFKRTVILEIQRKVFHKFVRNTTGSLKLGKFESSARWCHCF